MSEELEAIDKLFFRIYKLEIESKKLVGKFNMKQGDIILSSPSDNVENGIAGTLGGFVTKPNDPERKYALTCNHLFPKENLPAYAGASMQIQQIGHCVFTTREHNCDLAVIEIDKTMSQDCEITFRREDGTKTNAHVYDGSLADLGILHKIGAGSNVTKGTILSEEFYLKNLIDDDNRDSIFFVQGTGESFSKEGDSGSLVFSRPRHAKQNYVNVVGMIYGSKVIVDNADDSRDNESSSFKNEDEQHLLGSHAEPKFISGCYRIRPALDLFKSKKRVPVKFKDDLSTSSSSSSSTDDDF